MSAIRVELQLVDGSFTSGMLRAGQSLQEFNAQLLRTNPRLAGLANSSGSIVTSISRAEGATKGFLGTLRDVSVVTGLVSLGIGAMSNVANGFVGEIVRVNAEMERLRFQMQSMSTAKDPIADAARSVAYLRDQAKNMPFSLQTITNGFVKLKATGTDPMNGSLRAIADGIAAFGGNDEAFNRVVLGITQMSGKSVIQMEEMRQQLGESMPAAMQIMARSMGVSVADLTKAISTGRVAASTALAGFYEELERTYGGEAQRMMETFSGQMSQLKTNLQNLATNEGGRGFFDQVKAQLIDINRFLQSDMANRFATSFGQGLSSVVQWLRNAISAAWEFRNEIQNIAVAAAAGVGFIALARGASSLVSAFGTLGNGLKLARVEMDLAGAAMARFTLLNNSGAPAMMQLGQAATTVGLAARGIAVGFAAAAPWVAAIGFAAYTAGTYFGFFSNKVKEAYEELQKYGAESRAQAEQIVAGRRAQLEKMIADIENLPAIKWFGNMDSELGRTLTAAREELAKLNAESNKLIEDAGNREQENATAKYQRELDGRFRAEQQAYAQRQVVLQRTYDEEQGKLRGNIGEQKRLNEKYQEDLLKSAQELSSKKISILDGERDLIQERIRTSGSDQLAVLKAQLAVIDELWLREKENLKNLKAPDGVSLINPSEDDGKKIERGAKALESLKDDVTNLQAKVQGADGAFAEMQARIARGDYGSIDEATDAVREMHEELLEATAQKEALDKIMKGQQKADQDLANVRQNVLEKEFELKKKIAGEDMTDADSFLLKLNDGYYDGLGPIDNIREAVMGVIGALNLQGGTLNEIGIVQRENTFGSQTVGAIDTVINRVRQLVGELNNVGTALKGADFSTFGQGLMGGFGMGGGQSITRFSGSILELIAKGESGGNYNATLDNGLWTGGPQNLTSMTLSQVRELQRKMLANPANRAKYGDGKGSSALGKYQIVGQTLEGLMRSMGLSGNELFDENMQDAMAMRLLQGRQGQGLTGLREEWTSLRNVPDQVIRDALAGASNGPTREAAALQNGPSAAPGRAPTPLALPVFNEDAAAERSNELIQQRVAATEKLKIEAEELAKRERAVNAETDKVKRSEYLDKLIEKTKTASNDTEDLGKHYSQLADAIKGGQLGNNRDVGAEEYKKLIDAAKELDRVETEARANDRLKKDTDKESNKLKEEAAELNRRIAEQQARVKDPNYKADSSALQDLTTKMDAYLEKLKTLYGEDSDQYRQALATKSAMLNQQSLLDATTERAKLAQQNRDVEDSLLTQTELRKREMERQIALIDQNTQAIIAAGGNEVQATEEAERMKASIRAKYAQESSPMQKQFQEWSDIQGQLAQKSAQWMDSLAGGLTDLVMGTGDLKSVINGIMKDVVNMGIKWAMSGLGNKGGAAPAPGQKAAKTAKAGKSGAFPVRHRGGLADGSGSRRAVSGLAFMNAAKFHSGGIIGPRLHNSEVPIIAQKGEGVFTPDQMAAMGGFQQNQAISINAPISVQGSSGTEAQNQDLAERMAKQMEGTMRGIVVSEIQKQSRPGNMLNNKGR